MFEFLFMPDITLLTNLLMEFAWLGNWLFFFLAFTESAPLVGVFVPGATLVTIGGFLASQGYLNPWDILLFATLGAILGDFFSYSLGRWGGEWIKEKKIINHTILLHGEQFFYKYGNTSIFWGRFFGPIRAIIPFVAGLLRMKRGPFVFWNILSAICWAILNVGAGYFSGSLIIRIFERWSKGITYILILSFIIGVFYWFIKKRGVTLVNSFRQDSLKFLSYLGNKKWFIKLNTKYEIISDFFREHKYAPEKLYGSVLSFSFLIIIYILILVLDVF